MQVMVGEGTSVKLQHLWTTGDKSIETEMVFDAFSSHLLPTLRSSSYIDALRPTPTFVTWAMDGRRLTDEIMLFILMAEHHEQDPSAISRAANAEYTILRVCEACAARKRHYLTQLAMMPRWSTGRRCCRGCLRVINLAIRQ